MVHDNVIEIYGVAEAAGLPYLVMPYVRGPSLQRRLDDEGPLAVVEILRVGMQAAAGLAAAHAQGLVHRDVKPANILLADGIERVKLTDFGLARAADDASLTKTGIIAGTPQYMSPEQARGEAVDQRSDLFSLGSVLYAMCTGRPPFRAETSYGVLRRITDEEPRPIREINPEIPEWLCGIVAKLMAKRPDDRFQSAQRSRRAAGRMSRPRPAADRRAVAGGTPLSRAGRGAGGERLAARSSQTSQHFLQRNPSHARPHRNRPLRRGRCYRPNPPDISGNWQGEDWGQVTLTQTAPGEYTGTYTDTVAKEKDPGKIDLKWSRIERRFNGTWREGEDRFGDLSIRLADKEIRGALTTDPKSKINPATPRLADLVWTRGEYTANSGAARARGSFARGKTALPPSGPWPTRKRSPIPSADQNLLTVFNNGYAGDPMPKEAGAVREARSRRSPPRQFQRRHVPLFRRARGALPEIRRADGRRSPGRRAITSTRTPRSASSSASGSAATPRSRPITCGPTTSAGPGRAGPATSTTYTNGTRPTPPTAAPTRPAAWTTWRSPISWPTTISPGRRPAQELPQPAGRLGRGQDRTTTASAATSRPIPAGSRRGQLPPLALLAEHLDRLRAEVLPVVHRLADHGHEDAWSSTSWAETSRG